ncbi:roundabout homolog 4 isoform X2 [Phaenicophaeus curvirostris]|uniref:roundabout homolog 4 isoform X2 n=1 Tax=Phaenicophaeus curvirostris TaxID=33595 RepID=UPI0037F09B95
MAHSWVMALALGLCLTTLRHGGCHPPGAGTAPQSAAALRDNFRLQPGDLVATAGQALELDCVPPLGHPEPHITWKKDGVTLTGDRYVVTNGKLRVAPARRSDSGLYVCVAANTAGERESRSAHVSVLEKPAIVQHPGDAAVVAGSTAELGCGVQGDPAPRVQWHKEHGDLPWGRHEVDREHTLRLYAVTSADAGTYVCTAQSPLGTAAATIRLRVEDRLPTGRQEAVPWDLLAVRLHLDNGTVLPTAAVLLRWRMLMPAPVPEGYLVLYRSLLPVSTSWVQHNAGRELSTIIPRLRRGYKYEFKVRPYAGVTQGVDSNSRHLWVPEEVPSAAPQHITVSQAGTGNSTMVVSWEPPPPEAHNGIIQGYKIWSMSEGWEHPTNRTVDGDTRRLETTFSRPGAEFCVQVAAFNGAGLGVPSNATCSILGLMVGSSGVAQALQQPAVIAAAGSLLWLALLALLLLICQRRASQDAAARRLVSRDSPWLGGPWKPGCGPQTLSSSSSLSSRLLGSDSRDPHPSSLSLEPPSPCGDGGHPGVHSSPSTPGPTPWDRVHKRELHQAHSTPLSPGGPVPIPVSGGEWGADLGLAVRWPQLRVRDDDTTTATVARGDPWQPPVFSSPKLWRDRASLGSGVPRPPVTPPRPPHAWHRPVTRSPATALPRDTSPASRCPKDTSSVTEISRDMSSATRCPRDTSPVSGIPRDMSPIIRHPKDTSPATGIPKNMSPATRHPKDSGPVTGIPRDVSLVTRHLREMSLVSENLNDMFLATRHPKEPPANTRCPKDTSLVTDSPREVSLVTRQRRDMSLVSENPKGMFLAIRHPKDSSPTTRHPRDTVLATRQSEGTSLVTKCSKDMSPATIHPRDTSPVRRHQRDMSPATRHPKDIFLASGHPRDTSPVTRLPKEKSPATRYAKDMSPDTRHTRDSPPIIRHPEEMAPATSPCKDMFLVTRYPKDVSLATWCPRDLSPMIRYPRDMLLITRYPEDVSADTRHPRDTSAATGHPRDTSPVTRHPEEMSPVSGHWRDMFSGDRYPKNVFLAASHSRDPSLVIRHPRSMFPASRYPKDTSPTTRHPRDRSPVTGRLSPVFSDGVLTPQQVAEDLEMDQDTPCPSPPALTTPRSFSPPHTYGYIYGPPASELGEEEEEEEEEEQPVTRGSPGGSLLNGWGSVSEDNFASTRCSLVSSCDGSFLLDASFARALAVAVDGLCFSLEDTDGGYGGERGLSLPPSPLDEVFLPGIPSPSWDWGTAVGITQRAGTEAAAGTPQHGGRRLASGSPWARGGSETGGTRAQQCRTRQGQGPLSSAKTQLY